MFTLRVTAGLSETYVINLRMGTNRIGRAPDNNIVLDHPTVSEQHAVITVNERGALIEDLGSTNGTLLNGEPIQGAVSLQPNDQITFGTTVQATFSKQGGDQEEGRESKQLPEEDTQPAATRKPLRGLKWLGVGALVIALAAVAWYIWQQRQALTPEEVQLYIDQTVQAANPQVDEPATATETPSSDSTPDSTAAPNTREAVISQDFNISNLSVASQRDYEIVMHGLTSGATAFIDNENATLEQLPDSLEGLTYISTAEGDKFNNEDVFLSFTSDVDLSVYITYDQRYASKPAWLDSFSRLQSQIILSAGGGTFDVYKREFQAGDLVLGGNYPPGEVGDYGMYIVILAPSSMQAPLSESASGLPAITLSGGSGYIFSTSRLSTGDRDLWWNGAQLSPNPSKMMSLGQVNSLLDVSPDQDFSAVDYGSFEPSVGEAFVLEINRDDVVSYAVLRVLSLEGGITFEFIYPLE